MVGVGAATGGSGTAAFVGEVPRRDATRRVDPTRLAGFGAGGSAVGRTLSGRQ